MASCTEVASWLTYWNGFWRLGELVSNLNHSLISTETMAMIGFFFFDSPNE